MFCLICNVQVLNLFNNQIGDAGLSAVAEAVGKGALPQLQELYLSGNSIGDVGLSALADVVSRGALASLKEIMVDNKHMRHPQLVAACQPRGIEIR